MNIFSAGEGVLLILGYAILAFLVSFYFTSKSKSKRDFLVAGHNVDENPAAFSIAATWIWAPALFVAAEKAYTQGIAGVFWFTVPNALCLVIFAYFALKLRDKFPRGITISEYMKTRFSGRVQKLYLIELIGLAICSFAVQLLAGGKVVSTLTGIPFVWVTVAMAGIALIYSLFSGIKASIVTDYLQMILILLVSSLIVPWIIAKGGFNTIIDGLGGISGEYSNIFNGYVAYSFGITASIGLLSGPFGDQSFWQRAFSIKRNVLKKAFIKSAGIFVVVPILMSLLGFMAAGQGWVIADTGIVNLETVVRMLPVWVVVPFVYMIMSGLVSTLDSNLCSISSIFGHDLMGGDLMINEELEDEFYGSASIFIGRLGMWILAIFAVIIANIPGMKILYLFLFYGTFRATTLLPTIISIVSERVTEKGMFRGILFSMLIGVPIFALAKMAGSIDWQVAGSLITVLSSGIIVLMNRRKKIGGVLCGKEERNR